MTHDGKKQFHTGHFLSRLAIFIAAFLVLVMGAVYVLDPFYHYHAPWCKTKAVLVKPEYQVDGTLKNFDYDAVLFGSSVVENFDTGILDAAFSTHTVKAVQNSGTTADLLHYAHLAFERADAEDRQLSYVFWALEPSALCGDPAHNFTENAGVPQYLYDAAPLNDVKYLLNKDVIFEDIPYLLYESFLDAYRTSEAYAWYEGKEFSREACIRHAMLDKPAGALPDSEIGRQKQNAAQNIELLKAMVAEHTETEFVFILPPYSAFYWEFALEKGLLSTYCEAMCDAVTVLLSYGNVRVYDFMTDLELTTGLERYMDTVHIMPEVNREMERALSMDCPKLGKRRVLKEDSQAVTTAGKPADILTGDFEALIALAQTTKIEEYSEQLDSNNSGN